MAKEFKKIKKDQNEKQVATATLRYLRMSPRKVRLVATMIKGKSANDAQAQLMMHNRRASGPILKLLNSAIANSKQKKMNLDSLFISSIQVDKGPVLKRWMPRAQGRATPIHKFTSHIILELSIKEGGKKPKFVTEIKKAKKDGKRDHEHHEHEHEVEKEPIKKQTQKSVVVKEKQLESKTEVKKDAQTQDKGFMKKVFRRKSI